MSNDEIEKKINKKIKKKLKLNLTNLRNQWPESWDRDYSIEDKHKKNMNKNS